jgi:hypothetical protein
MYFSKNAALFNAISLSKPGHPVSITTFFIIILLKNIFINIYEIIGLNISINNKYK